MFAWRTRRALCTSVYWDVLISGDGSEALDCLILQEFKGQNVATPAKYLRKCVDRLILVAQNSSWFLDRLLKRTLMGWFHLIPVANISTGNVYVTTPSIIQSINRYSWSNRAQQS